MKVTFFDKETFTIGIHYDQGIYDEYDSETDEMIDSYEGAQLTIGLLFISLIFNFKY